MKYALMAQVEASLPAKADELVPTITARVAGKALWQGQENWVARGQSGDGKPTVSIEYRFDKLVDRKDLVTYLKSLDDRPNVKVTGRIHDCYHAEGGRSCDNWQEI